VQVLTDARATRANVVTALEELAQRADGGTALICFAGHGEPVGADYERDGLLRALGTA